MTELLRKYCVYVKCPIVDGMIANDVSAYS